MSLTVSVIIPVRDGERYLNAAIDSVLAEGIEELIVVDDGSTDRTASILESYGESIVRLWQPPTGQAAALNRGVERASGEVLGFQDADDLWEPGRQALLMAALTPDVDAVCGALEQFLSPELDADDAARFVVPEGPQPSQLLVTLLVRRAAFDAVGMFDTTLQSAQNVDWMSRARLVPLRFAQVPTVVARRRIHLSNQGRLRAEENRSDLVRVMRAHLDRKRSR